MTAEELAVDCVSITGLRAIGRHGWFDYERADGQEFVVDVHLFTDLSKASASDDLADTVDYGAVGSAVVAIIEGEPVRLIETLAERVAASCLADPRVRQVRVVVHKPQAPLTVAFEDVTITITRARP